MKVDKPPLEQGESLAYGVDSRSILLGSEGRNSPVYTIANPVGGTPAPSQAPAARAGLEVGTYMGSYSWDTHLKTFGRYADVETVYLSAKNQRKYTFNGYGSAGVPTLADSAAAWNRVMGFVAETAPDVVRVFWYGGAAPGKSAFAGMLRPELIQMATFDPYRWEHNRATDTAEQLWGEKIRSLQAQPWMREHGRLAQALGPTEWGTDQVHGDTANATFMAETLTYLRAHGAAPAVYFDSPGNAGTGNDFRVTDRDRPLSLASYLTSLLG